MEVSCNGSPPQVSYGLCSFFASPQSLANWAHERHTVFLGVETWQALLTDAAKLPELALEMNLDEFDTRHAKVTLPNLVNGEFDIPVSVAIVDDSGRAIVDLHTVPSTAWEPTIIPRPQRLLMSQLYSKIALLPFTGYGFSLAPQETLGSSASFYDRAYPLNHGGGNRITRTSKSSQKKRQILDLDGITPAYGHTTANSIRHFQAVRAKRPCNCTTYLTTSFPSKTFMVVWDYQDLEILGGAPHAGMVIVHTLSTDMALPYLSKFGNQPPVPEALYDLATVSTTLEEAYHQIVGFPPSLQVKTRKLSGDADMRAQMLRELYLTVEAFNRKYCSTFDRAQIHIPPLDMERLNRVHGDPETLTVRPYNKKEQEPYMNMTYQSHLDYVTQAVQRRVPRYLHFFCKQATEVVKDVPESPLVYRADLRCLKASKNTRINPRRRAVFQQLYPGVQFKETGFRRSAIPHYRQMVFRGAFDTYPIVVLGDPSPTAGEPASIEPECLPTSPSESPSPSLRPLVIGI